MRRIGDKRGFILIFFLCLVIQLHAHNQGDVYFKLAEKAANAAGNGGSTALSDSLALLALDKYRQEGDYKGVVKCYNHLLVSAFSKGNNFKAREYAGKALISARQGRLERQTGVAYSNLSVVNSRMGDLELANEYNFKALKIFNLLSDTVQIARCNLSIGTVYIQLDEHDKALKYLENAKSAFFKAGDETGYSISLSNLGSVYLSLKKYGEALQNFYEALSLDEKNNDKLGVTSNYISIGKIYQLLENNKQATEYYNKARLLASAMGDMSGMASVNFQIARLKFAERKIDSAYYYANKSYNYYKETGELSGRQRVLDLLSDIYSAMGNPDKALSSYRMAVKLKDSLFNIEKAAKLAVMEEKYINQRLINENLGLKFINELQETKITAQKNVTLSVAGGLLVVLAAMIIIAVQLRKKNSAYRFLVKKNLSLMQKDEELQQTRMQLIMTEELKDERPKILLADDEKDKLLRKLSKLLNEEKIYTRTDLTIDKLARRLSTNRTYLSQLINDVYNKSYSDFINEFRVSEAMRLLSDPETGNKFSIEAIAREAGFNTISNFNVVFRKSIGITPSLFRKNADNQSSIKA